MAFKEDFLKGCRDGGGTPIEDADGSFGCSIGNVQIKCTGESCKIAAPLAPGVDISVGLNADAAHKVVAVLSASSADPKQSGSR